MSETERVPVATVRGRCEFVPGLVGLGEIAGAFPGNKAGTHFNLSGDGKIRPLKLSRNTNQRDAPPVIQNGVIVSALPVLAEGAPRICGLQGGFLPRVGILGVDVGSLDFDFPRAVVERDRQIGHMALWPGAEGLRTAWVMCGDPQSNLKRQILAVCADHPIVLVSPKGSIAVVNLVGRRYFVRGATHDDVRALVAGRARNATSRKHVGWCYRVCAKFGYFALAETTVAEQERRLVPGSRYGGHSWLRSLVGNSGPTREAASG